MELESDFISSLYGRGNTYHLDKKYSEAVRDYTRAIEIDNGDPDYYFHRGITYYNMRSYNEAVEDYTRAIEIRPRKWYYSLRSKAYEKMGETQKAEEDKESAAKALK